MNKSRRDILYKENMHRGDGSKKQSDKLGFLSNRDNIDNKYKSSGFRKSVTKNKYLVSKQERLILRDSVIKCALLKMDNNRLLNEIEKYKLENDRLKSKN